ncbi:MAG: hypothetical protein ABSA26_02170 [Thermoguttaceae bacterium]|jgi:hypothetical protein
MPKITGKPLILRKYPFNTLRQCLRLGLIVKNNGGERAGVPKSVIAQGLDMDQGSASFSQLAASSKTFGIVEGSSDLFLTELGREYYFQTSENGSKIAGIEFLSKPSAFEYLIKKFDGSRLPSSSIMGNLIGKYCGVPESWRTRAAQIFLSAASEVGVMDGNMCLRYASTKHKLSVGNSQSALTTAQNPSSISDQDINLNNLPRTIIASTNSTAPSTDNVNNNVWVFSEDGKTIRVETPDVLTLSLWQRLKSYIDILVPNEGMKK